MSLASSFGIFERHVLAGEGSWIGSEQTAAADVARCNAYITDAGYERVPDTTLPAVMIAGIVRTHLFGRPSPLPSIVQNVNNRLEDSNHEEAFLRLCRDNKVHPFRRGSYWLGYVLSPSRETDGVDPSYHLVLDTRGNEDGLRPSARRNIAAQLVKNLGKLGACVVIEATDSVFDARTGASIEPHEAGIDFSVPW
jgi:hypothetical protein